MDNEKEPKLGGYEIVNKEDIEELDDIILQGTIEDLIYGKDFKIESDEQAEKFIKKEKSRRANIQRLIDLCDTETARISERRQTLVAELEQDSFYKTQLMIYLENAPQEFVKETKTQKSYKLLSGTIVKKKGGLQAVRDSASLLNWAKSTDPALVRVKEEADWAKIKKDVELTEDGAIYKPTGEFVEGVTTEMKPDTFDIKFNEEG